MTQSHRRSGRPVVKDNVVLNARRASGKPKSNATSFKKGRMKTGGRKAGTPNKATRSFRELMLAAAEAAGNEMGGDGHVSYLKFIALNHPKIFLPQYASSMTQQLEHEQISPPEDERVLHTGEEIREELRRESVPPVALVVALIDGMTPEERENVRKWSKIMTVDRRVEDDASNDSTRGGEV